MYFILIVLSSWVSSSIIKVSFKNVKKLYISRDIGNEKSINLIIHKLYFISKYKTEKGFSICCVLDIMLAKTRNGREEAKARGKKLSVCVKQ